MGQVVEAGSARAPRSLYLSLVTFHRALPRKPVSTNYGSSDLRVPRTVIPPASGQAVSIGT